ncbi:MAG: HigA family addiction module antitoxin [Treponema sp.]|nr:HigA family addiction module antitoxin [Treponema sp.]
MSKKIIITVGDILKEEYLDPMGISAYRLAHEIGVSTSLMSQILRGVTAISADVAWRLGKFFDTSAQYWLNMQATCDSRKVEEKYAKKKLEISSYKQFIKTSDKQVVYG